MCTTSNASELTQRELDVCKLLLKGYTSQQIADSLCISKATVHNHRYNIKQKLKAKTNVDLGGKIASILKTKGR